MKPSEPVVAATSSSDDSSVTARLTPAERRVLDLLPTYLTLAAIGDRLDLTRATVKTHVEHIYAKLAVRTRSAAVERARELGMLGALESPGELPLHETPGQRKDDAP